MPTAGRTGHDTFTVQNRNVIKICQNRRWNQKYLRCMYYLNLKFLFHGSLLLEQQAKTNTSISEKRQDNKVRESCSVLKYAGLIFFLFLVSPNQCGRETRMSLQLPTCWKRQPISDHMIFCLLFLQAENSVHNLQKLQAHLINIAHIYTFYFHIHRACLKPPRCFKHLKSKLKKHGTTANCYNDKNSE